VFDGLLKSTKIWYIYIWHICIYMYIWHVLVFWVGLVANIRCQQFCELKVLRFVAVWSAANPKVRVRFGTLGIAWKNTTGPATG
jgi:hypothetical protein